MPDKIKYITVLMSVYNDSRYLRSSMKSILNQTHKDFEFLIIDDGSEENIEEIVKSFNDSRIVYKRINHIGLAGALNFGLKNSTGDWIARIDADDLNTCDRLEAQLKFINSNSGYDIVSGWSVYFKDPHKILFELKSPVENSDIKKFLNLHNPINHSSVIFNKGAVLDGGGYNENFNSYEDFELWFRLRGKLNFKILPEILVYTRVRNNSMTMTSGKNNVYEMLKVNGEKKLMNAKGKNEKYYWMNVIFWIEYFYGDKAKARNYFGNEISFKKAIAFLNTYLPDKAFDKIMGLRIRYRLQTKNVHRKVYEKQLKELLNKPLQNY